MTGDRLLIDTTFVQAILSGRDQYHSKAKGLIPQLRAAREVVVTEAVLLEVGNALAAIDRSAEAGWIERSYRTPRLRVVPVETALLLRALRLYGSRPDKGWSLTDCLSFEVMHDEGIESALSADHHFRQAGFRALMLEA